MKIAILAAALCVSTQLPATGLPSAPVQPSIHQPSATPAFSFVRGHKQGKGYNIQFSMTSNAGIDHFEIEYTYEDATDPYSNWYVCGRLNNTNLNVNRFTDMGALPGTINYRVIAYMTSGGTVTSAPYTTDITP
jgi:hypothetical protein